MPVGGSMHKWFKVSMLGPKTAARHSHIRINGLGGCRCGLGFGLDGGGAEVDHGAVLGRRRSLIGREDVEGERAFSVGNHH